MLTIETTKDANLLSRLNRPVQEWHASRYPSLFKPYDKESIEKFFDELLKSEQAEAYVALKDEEPAGYLVVMLQHRPENAFAFAISTLLIDQIGVLPDFRRKGIASALLRHALQHAKSLGVNKIVLEHWEANQGASTFFMKSGFREQRSQLFLTI